MGIICYKEWNLLPSGIAASAGLSWHRKVVLKHFPNSPKYGLCFLMAVHPARKFLISPIFLITG